MLSYTDIHQMWWFVFGKSYHITKKIGNSYVFWWPASGFGQYCTKQKYAQIELNRLIFEHPGESYRLISRPAVRNILGHVVGVTSTSELIQDTHKDKITKE